MSASAARDLQAKLGADKVLTSLGERRNYRYDGIMFGATPTAVVLPLTTDDVVRTVRYAREVGLPVVGRGAASGLTGGAVPLGESIVVSFTRMTALEIHPERREARAQAGVITNGISERARPHGLVYPPDPASFRTSTIGGNIGENAGGPACFKYGVTGDYVKALQVVDDAGDVHEVDRSAYDVAGLFIGSEGTLGLVTEATLRLEPPPRFVRTLLAHFPEVGQCAQAVSDAVAAGAVPAKLEFLDRSCIRAVEDYLQLGLPVDAEALLIVDTDGDDEALVEEELLIVERACRAQGGVVRRAASVTEAAELWRARRAVSPALGRIRPRKVNEDIVVPRSMLPSVVRDIRALGERSGMPIVQFGHIGDGNLHPNILFGSDDDEAVVHELAHEIARIAIRAGGALSGEHGIGVTKQSFMNDAIDPETMAVLRDVKRAFDPRDLLNPGKLLPLAGEPHGEPQREQRGEPQREQRGSPAGATGRTAAGAAWASLRCRRTTSSSG